MEGDGPRGDAGGGAPPPEESCVGTRGIEGGPPPPPAGPLDCCALSCCKLGGKPPGMGRFLRLIQTIKCIAMANSNLSNRLSTGASTMFQMAANCGCGTPDLENNSTAACPYTYPSSAAYFGNKSS